MAIAIFAPSGLSSSPLPAFYPTTNACRPAPAFLRLFSFLGTVTYNPLNHFATKQRLPLLAPATQGYPQPQLPVFLRLFSFLGTVTYNPLNHFADKQRLPLLAPAQSRVIHQLFYVPICFNLMTYIKRMLLQPPIRQIWHLPYLPLLMQGFPAYAKRPAFLCACFHLLPSL